MTCLEWLADFLEDLKFDFLIQIWARNDANFSPGFYKYKYVLILQNKISLSILR